MVLGNRDSVALGSCQELTGQALEWPGMVVTWPKKYWVSFHKAWESGRHFKDLQGQGGFPGMGLGLELAQDRWAADSQNIT